MQGQSIPIQSTQGPTPILSLCHAYGVVSTWHTRRDTSQPARAIVIWKHIHPSLHCRSSATACGVDKLIYVNVSRFVGGFSLTWYVCRIEICSLEYNYEFGGYYYADCGLYMLLYTSDFVCRVGFSYLGCRRFDEGNQAQAQ